MNSNEGQINFTHGPKTIHDIQCWAHHLVNIFGCKLMRLYKKEANTESTKLYIEEYKLQIGQIIKDIHMKINSATEIAKDKELNIILENMEYLNELTHQLIPRPMELDKFEFMYVDNKDILEPSTSCSLICWAQKLIENFGWKMILKLKDNNVSKMSKISLKSFGHQIEENILKIDNALLFLGDDKHAKIDLKIVQRNLKYLHLMFKIHILGNNVLTSPIIIDNDNDNDEKIYIAYGGSKNKKTSKKLTTKKTSKKITTKKTSKKPSKKSKNW
jgi:hypothetical protein